MLDKFRVKNTDIALACLFALLFSTISLADKIDPYVALEEDKSQNLTSPDPLKILSTDVDRVNPDYLKYIKLVSGAFEIEFNDRQGSFDAILIARVIHFMNPEEVNNVLKIAYKILRPGGKIYAVMLSPYVRGYASFIPEFEKRIKTQQPNPGYVNNLLEYADKSLLSEKMLADANKPFFFFDIRTAKTLFENAGFLIQKNIEMPIAYHSAIWGLDGRENIGIIAVKPK